MPTHSGPNTKGEENLVFGYDLGDTRNSFKGEPTENIWAAETGFNVNQRTGWSMPKAYDGSITDTVYTDGTWNGNRIWEVLHTAGTTGYGGFESWRLCVNQPLASAYSTTRRVAIKICILEGSISDLAIHSGGGNASHNSSYFTPIPESQVPRDCPQKSGWYQFLSPANWSSTTVGHCVGLGFITLNRVRILTTEPMYYPADRLIPFTAGTRSATQGLLDVTGNSTIDLSNMSFDSNAQMTFDGTNDHIALTGNILNVDSFTIEAVVNITSVGNYNKPIFVAGDLSTAGIWFFKHRSGLGNRLVMHGYDGVNPRIDVDSVDQVPDAVDTYVAVTFNGNAYQLYMNGEPNDSAVVDNKVGATTTNYIGKQGGTYLDGDIPMMKIYNRALTASEIKANYNAIKGRFNI